MSRIICDRYNLVGDQLQYIVFTVITMEELGGLNLNGGHVGGGHVVPSLMY